MKILAVISIIFFSFSSILACTCVNTSNISDAQHSKYLKEVKAIFYGEVISLGEKRDVEYTAAYQNTYQAVKFKVLRSWKGVDSPKVTVETEIKSNCMYIPDVGNRIMVYAYESKELKIPLLINYCSIGKFNDERMKREYGEGKVFEEPTPQQSNQQPEPQEGFWSWIWQKIVPYSTKNKLR